MKGNLGIRKAITVGRRKNSLIRWYSFNKVSNVFKRYVDYIYNIKTNTLDSIMYSNTEWNIVDAIERVGTIKYMSLLEGRMPLLFYDNNISTEHSTSILIGLWRKIWLSM